MSTETKIPSTLRMAQRLGKRILGEQQVERITAAKKQGALRLGPRVTGEVEVVVPAALGGGDAPNPDGNGDGYLNLGELRAALLLAPASLDGYLAAELEKDPPRKGALQLFLVTEEAKGEAARAEVIASVKSALDTLAG